MIQYWWVIPFVAWSALQGWLSKEVYDKGDLDWKFWTLYGINIFVLWPWICRVSKNLLFDAFLYDMIFVIGFYVVVMWMGAAEEFNKWQWLGVCLSLMGIMILKYATYNAGLQEI